jgi:large subunit ribosomal protein L25
MVTSRRSFLSRWRVRTSCGWDHLGKEILHLDFSRVSAEEVIETEVSLELRGVAAGVANGGILEHLVHSLSIKCKAGAIPDSIKVDVSHLQVEQGIHVRDLVLPPDVTANADADLLLIHVVVRGAQEATAEAAPDGTTQPEVIKPERKEKEKDA